jgi:hypothetical protein
MIRFLRSLLCPPEDLGSFFYWGVEYPVRELLWYAGPETTVSVNELRWLLDQPVWTDERDRPITPRQVMRDSLRFSGHFSRIMAADIQHPILLFADGDEVGVADGYHRICRAVLYNQTHLPARWVTLR